MSSKEQRAYSKQKIQGLIWFGFLCFIAGIVLVYVTENWAAAIIITIIGSTAFILSAIEGLQRKIIEDTSS